MAESTFQQIEGKLYWYYETIRKIEMLQIQADALWERRNNLIEIKSESRESLCYQGGSGQFGSERVQGKKSIYHSPIESAHEANQELSAEIHEMWEKVCELETRIVQLRNQTDDIRIALGQLNPFDKEITEYKYRYKMSIRQIARIKNMNKNTIERQRQRIVGELGKMLEVG